MSKQPKIDTHSLKYFKNTANKCGYCKNSADISTKIGFDGENTKVKIRIVCDKKCGVQYQRDFVFQSQFHYEKCRSELIGEWNAYDDLKT